DTAGALLCDADLEVLGRSPEAYRRYVQAVRRDFAHVPDADWARGRAAVLESLLGAERLYRTAPGRARWEAAARRNLEAELADLRP
ncbi:non-ribosomal peptide synthetase, partial [Micrococcus sp. HG099]|nr:non-ribosomal peptide synthetase [Micrococcus sp. HG099]